MKRFFKMLTLIGAIIPLSFTFAETDSWGVYGDSPTAVFENIVGEANTNQQIQETAMDGINSDEGAYQQEYQISNTLDWIRMHMGTYLQWIVYVGLTIAVILLIYNGFMMVTHSITKSGDFAKLKKNLQYIAIGVIILTSFYAILRLVIGLINSVFGTNSSGDTGF